MDGIDILDPFQSSFNPGHRMETTLVILMDDLYRQLDQAGSRWIDVAVTS